MKGWYGNKHAHSLASKGIRTCAKGEFERRPFFVQIKNGYLIRSGYNSISINDIYNELVARQNLKLIPEYWDITKTMNGIHVEISDIDKERRDMEALFIDLGLEKSVMKEESGVDRTIDNGRFAKNDTTKKRENISKKKEQIDEFEFMYNRLRRNLAFPEDFGYTNISKKDLMKEIESKLNSLRGEVSILDKEISLISSKQKSINTKNNEKEKTINRKDNYHIRRN